MLKVVSKVMPLLFKNNVSIILGSKSEIFYNIKTRQNVGIFIENDCT